MDIQKSDLAILPPGTLRVGDIEDVTAIAEILHGTVAIDLPNILQDGAIASASAAIAALDTTKLGTWRMYVQAQDWSANEPVLIVNAAAINGGVQVTGQNLSGAAVDVASHNFSYLAIRTIP